ncbi:MAG: sigma-70 family RNA polymerase sigma factor [Clostridia bacterium]|nr:sigma-70 family RNA polymerase sigma factor [Clostridia bacterium]
MRYTEDNFKEIYDKTYDNNLKYIVLKTNVDDANDVIQEVYIELLNKLKKEKSIEIDNIDGFVFGITKNVLKRFYKNINLDKNIFVFSTEDTNEEIADSYSLEDDFINDTNISLIWDEIRKKEDVIQKIFYLYYVLDIKISDIAESMNINESTIKTKIYRTLKELKEKLEKEGDQDE